MLTNHMQVLTTDIFPNDTIYHTPAVIQRCDCQFIKYKTWKWHDRDLCSVHKQSDSRITPFMYRSLTMAAI